jgi:hypothetical protein
MTHLLTLPPEVMRDRIAAVMIVPPSELADIDGFAFDPPNVIDTDRESQRDLHPGDFHDEAPLRTLIRPFGDVRTKHTDLYDMACQEFYKQNTFLATIEVNSADSNDSRTNVTVRYQLGDHRSSREHIERLIVQVQVPRGQVVNGDVRDGVTELLEPISSMPILYPRLTSLTVRFMNVAVRDSEASSVAGLEDEVEAKEWHRLRRLEHLLRRTVTILHHPEFGRIETKAVELYQSTLARPPTWWEVHTVVFGGDKGGSIEAMISSPKSRFEL